jgi:hypothetical protein
MPRDNTTPEAALDPRIDERRLFQEAQAGDLEAFSAAALQLSPRLVRQALLLCGEMEQALDLAQESLVRGWRNLHQYRAQAAPFTWLCVGSVARSGIPATIPAGTIMGLGSQAILRFLRKPASRKELWAFHVVLAWRVEETKDRTCEQ